MSPRDDSMLDRFESEGVRHVRARDGVIAVAVCALLLVVAAGDAVRVAADRLPQGIGQDAVAAVGGPTGWVADRLPVADARRSLTGFLSPDTELIGEGFEQTVATGGTDALPGTEPSIPPITADSFDPVAIGQEIEERPTLERLLVTGDSMSMPLDEELARLLSDEGVETVREPQLGSGITLPQIVDWGRLSETQVQAHEPDAVVMFLGAGDGYPLPGPDGPMLECCSVEWAAAYATRVRQMMDTYRQEGGARLYWLTVPTPRNEDRAEVTRVVNEAIAVAAQPWRSQVRVVDLVEVLTPGGIYTDSLEVDGTERLVRDSDGLHLSSTGAELVAELLLERLEDDFER